MPAPYRPYQPVRGDLTPYDLVQAQEAVRSVLDTLYDRVGIFAQYHFSATTNVSLAAGDLFPFDVYFAGNRELETAGGLITLPGGSAWDVAAHIGAGINPDTDVQFYLDGSAYGKKAWVDAAVIPQPTSLRVLIPASRTARTIGLYNDPGGGTMLANPAYCYLIIREIR